MSTARTTMVLQSMRLSLANNHSSFHSIYHHSTLFSFPSSSARWFRGHRHCLGRAFSASAQVPISKKHPCFALDCLKGVYASFGTPCPTDSMHIRKKRLDEVCLERFQQYSRTFIQSWIIQGKVYVNGKVVNKAGTPVSDKAVVEIKAEIPKYVCRAGYKLEAAIEQLEVDVSGKIALDSGLSTGGFTDCLLQHGAAHVYGVDVGYGQVADKVRRDERVSVIERTNLRYLPELPQQVDLVTLDLSFISILLVMPAVVKVMKEQSTLITLVKPQFEAKRSQVGGGGIVRDPAVHQEVLERIIKGVESFGFQNKGQIESPLKGAEGNTEFLVCFERISDKVI